MRSIKGFKPKRFKGKKSSRPSGRPVRGRGGYRA